MKAGLRGRKPPIALIGPSPGGMETAMQSLSASLDTSKGPPAPIHKCKSVLFVSTGRDLAPYIAKGKGAPLHAGAWKTPSSVDLIQIRTESIGKITQINQRTLDSHCFFFFQNDDD